uniref:TIGR04372 family glycosyltransferase n=1 Tax=Algoriphagus sp. TaxID=1872435 RepID=UPI004048336E
MFFKRIKKLLSYTVVLISLFIIRIIRPLVLIRFGSLFSYRIGHYAGNTELYLCEIDAGINKPQKFCIDLFYLQNPICNQQLTLMLDRTLTILPAWFLMRMYLLNQIIPGGKVHQVGFNSNMDRDIHNLLDKYPVHLNFTDAEERKGVNHLTKMGIPEDAKFVCLLVRDDSYLKSFQPGNDWSAHDYRNSNIQNYILACEELADRGYFVIRMGVKVNEPINSAHPKIIDYAFNGMRDDFMDIYLGAKCEFCITTSAGWDAVPGCLFRKPLVFTNIAPLGFMWTFSSNFLALSKKYLKINDNRELSLSEIFSNDLAFCLDTEGYKSNGIVLVENTPEEIRDVVIEMHERLTGVWHSEKDDEELQAQFWKSFPRDSVSEYNGAHLHGEIKSRFSSIYLRNNKTWFQ